ARALSRVEAGGRLVEAEQGGLGAHRARDLESALVAIGQIAGGIVGAIDEADALQPEFRQIDRALFRGAINRRTDQPEKGETRGQHQRVVLSHHQILQRRHAGEQADVLEGAGDLGLFGDTEVVEPLQRDLGRALAHQAERAAGRPVEAGDAVEHRGLASAVGTDQRGDLFRGRSKGQIVDGDDAAETHDQMIDREDGLAHPCPSLTRSEEIACARLRNTVGARWPISPRGRQIINSTMAMPNTSMRYCSRPRNSSKPPIMAIEASATPSCEPMPPSTTMASTSADSWKVKDSGEMKPWRVAKNAPAKPPNMAPVANAVSLVVVVLMPSARQATSSSRSASQARPIGSRRRRIVTQLVSSASARIK